MVVSPVLYLHHCQCSVMHVLVLYCTHVCLYTCVFALLPAQYTVHVSSVLCVCTTASTVCCVCEFCIVFALLPAQFAVCKSHIVFALLPVQYAVCKSSVVFALLPAQCAVCVSSCIVFALLPVQ